MSCFWSHVLFHCGFHDIMPCLWGHAMLHSVLNHVPVHPFLCFDCCSSPWTHVSDMFHHDHPSCVLKNHDPEITWPLNHMTSKRSHYWLLIIWNPFSCMIIFDKSSIWLYGYLELQVVNVKMEITIQGFVSSLSATIASYKQSSFSPSCINIHENGVSERWTEISIDRRCMQDLEQVDELERWYTHCMYRHRCMQF